MKLFLIVVVFCFFSCSDKINREDMYTFTGRSITDFVRSNREFSMYAKALEISHNSANSQSSVASLLNCRGNFTAFVPTNVAMTLYLDSVYGTKDYDIDTMSEDLANKIVLNSVMDFGNEKAFRETDMYEGAMVEPTLNDCNLNIVFGRYGNIGTNVFTKINGQSYIIRHDLEMTNGYVQVVNRVINPAPTSLTGLMALDRNISIFNHLLELTTWADSLLNYRDRSYVQPPSENPVFSYPKYKLAGYMAFAETDQLFHDKWGVPLPERDSLTGHVNNWDEIMQVINTKVREAYPDAVGSEYSSQGNALNQFVAYHLVNGKLPYSQLLAHSNEYGYDKDNPDNYTVDVWNYFETKGRNRHMFKITQVATDKSIRINRHSTYDNSFSGDFHETSCDLQGIEVFGPKETYGSNYARNGYYYTLGDILLYNNDVAHKVLDERIRYDVSQIMPELSSNNLLDGTNSEIIPKDFFRNVTLDNYCAFEYAGGAYMSESALDLYNCQSVIVKLMPVPYAGEWQIRAGCRRLEDCMDQIWFGDTLQLNLMQAIGTPTKSLYTKCKEAEAVFRPDSYYDYDSLYCLENDKALRNIKLMKGPKYYYDHTIGTNSFYEDRQILGSTRKILYTGYLEPGKNYYIRIQNKVFNDAIGHGSMLDYFELVPESIYDNPNKAEDIW